jgi:hypothetical protein
VQLTHEAIAQALRHDPHLTLSQIARWLDMHQSDFQRLYLDDKNPGGHPNKRVHVTSASRLMIALGRAPNELPGC